MLYAFEIVMWMDHLQKENLTLGCTTESICYINKEETGQYPLAPCGSVGKMFESISQLTFYRLLIMRILRGSLIGSMFLQWDLHK